MDNQKLLELKKYLTNLKRVAIAYSSGVDSTFLLKVSHEILKDNVIAITARSCSFPKRELDEAVKFCRENSIKHIIVDSEELEIEGFKNNPPNRCYLCKKELFSKIKQIAKENNIENIIEGSNIDDEGDYRPGMIAIKELDIKSPLKELGFTKKEIREFSKNLGLKTASKQSFACLSSRFPYGEEITKEKLNMVDKSEQFLLDLGFNQLRVRIHGNNLARIEVLPEEFEKLILNRKDIVTKLKEIGFKYISMDIEGYRTGSMNETLNS